MNCFSTAEAVVIHGTAAAAFAKAGIVRAHDFITGRDSIERRLAAHRANAEFLSEMGLDPDVVLGLPPIAAPARRLEPVRPGALGQHAPAVCARG